MARPTTSREGASHGAELASGFISLHVKYGSAMAQVSNDFHRLEEQGKASGARAGRAHGQALAHGMESGAKQGRIAAMREFANTEVEAKTRGEKIGKAIGWAIAQPIAIPARAVRGTIAGIGRAAEQSGDKVKEFGKEGSAAVASIVPGGSAAAGALAAIAPEAAVAGIALGAVVGPIGLLLEQGKEWDSMRNKFKFDLGMNQDQAQQMTNFIAKIGTEIPASFDTISEHTLEAQKNLHLTGDTLKTIVEQGTMLQQKGGIQLNYEGLGMLKRAMGSDGADMPKLLDQLYTASMKSGVQINNMIGALSHAAPLLKQFGLDAGQSATLLTQFDESGIDVNKVLPGLAKAYKASAKEGEPFNQFVKEQVENIQELVKSGNMTAAGAAAQKAFGSGIRGGGASVLTAIQNGQLDPEAWTKGPDGPQQSILGNSKAAETMGDKWKELTNQVEALMKPYAETLMRNVAGWFGQFAAYLKEHGPAIVAAIAHSLTNVRHAFDNFGHAMGNVGHAWDNFTHAMSNVGHAFGNIGHAIGNVGHAFGNVGHAIGNVVHAFDNIGHAIGNVIHAMENVKHAFDVAGDFIIKLPGKIGEAIEHMGSFLAEKIGNLFSGIHLPSFLGGKASGGPLDSAPGPIGRDSALFFGARGEHVLTSGDVKAMGGHKGVFAFRNALHRDGGGPVGPDVQAAMSMDGTPYSQGSRTDCSGMVARVIARTLGLSEADLPSTKNMGTWLRGLGFRTGVGGLGAIRVGWYDHGGGPNSGHAAMTLSDGENAESGGAGGGFRVGGGAAGADNPEFDRRMFLPLGDLQGIGSGLSSGIGGSGGSGSGGGGGVGGGGSIPPGSTRGTNSKGEQGYFTGSANNDKTQADQDHIVRLKDEIAKLENKRDHSKTALTAQQREQLDHELTTKQHELDKANRKLETDQRGDFHKMPKGHSGKGDKGNPFGQLADTAFKGGLESFLPPGFMNPFDNPLMKSAGAGMKFFGGLLGSLGSLAGGDAGGAVDSIMGAWNPQAAGLGVAPGEDGSDPGMGLPSPGGLPGIGNLPAAQERGEPGNVNDAGNAGGNVVDQSIHFSGKENQDQFEAARAHQMAQRRAGADTLRHGYV